MLDIENLSEDEYMEKSSAIFKFIHEFKDKWEAEPFGEPDILDFISRAEEFGNDVQEEVRYLLEVYIIYFAPEPKFSEEQYRARLEKVREYVGLYEQSTSNSKDGSVNGGDV